PTQAHAPAPSRLLPQFALPLPPPPPSPLFPYTTLFRSHIGSVADAGYNQAHAEGIQVMKKNLPEVEVIEVENVPEGRFFFITWIDRKSTRLNSSHRTISYAVFCLKKKTKTHEKAWRRQQ